MNKTKKKKVNTEYLIQKQCNGNQTRQLSTVNQIKPKAILLIDS